MASGFWYLQDGRGFSRSVQTMALMLEEIHAELALNSDAEEFAIYLSKYIPTEQHELNGYGGFHHKETGESIMMNIDFREFTKDNQERFWQAAQIRTSKLIKEDNKEELLMLLKELLYMNKRANKGEDPTLLNHMRKVEPPTGMKKGPGW